MRNSYLAVARLATHPAFSHRVAALVCPTCGNIHTKVSEYDRDFLAHNPDAELAWRKLSGKAYERHSARRGWPAFDEALNRWP